MDQGLFLGIDKGGTRTQAGLIGAIISVPIVTTGREIFNYLYAKIQQKDPYPESRRGKRKVTNLLCTQDSR